MPICILATTRIITIMNHEVKQVLVQWSNSYPEHATWENFQKFCALCNQLNLEDGVIFEERGSDKPVPLEMDSQLMDRQLEYWANQVMYVKNQAQLQEEPETSNAIEGYEGEEREGIQIPHSRRRNKPTWMKDYVM